MNTVAESARATVRAEHQVRLVEPHEEGTAAQHLPVGVYGFTGSPGLEAPLFSERRYRNFEVHHLRNGEVAIVGFVTPEQAHRLSNAGDTVEITMYPDAEESATVIVAISYAQIAQHRQYSIRNAPGFPLRVSPQPQPVRV